MNDKSYPPWHDWPDSWEIRLDSTRINDLANDDAIHDAIHDANDDAIDDANDDAIDERVKLWLLVDYPDSLFLVKKGIFD